MVQFAVFAAYHLSLETSFLADEGAHLPKMSLKPSYCPPITIAADDATSTLSCSDGFAPHSGSTDIATPSEGFVGKMEGSQSEASSVPVNVATDKKAHVPWDGSVADAAVASTSPATDNFFLGFTDSASGVVDPVPSAMVEKLFSDERQLKEVENIEENEVSSDYLAATESHQSILVSFSSRCVSKGTLCERSRLLRIRFYGSFDKPLGRYLRDDLFDQVILLFFLSCNIYARLFNLVRKSALISGNYSSFLMSKLTKSIHISSHLSVGLVRNQLKHMCNVIPTGRVL